MVHAMAGFDAGHARRDLHVPDDFAVEAMIAIGRPGRVEELPGELQAAEVPSGRRPLSALVCAGPFAF